MEAAVPRTPAERGLVPDLFSEQRRVLSRVASLPRAVALACATRVGTTPHDVVFTRGGRRLLRYRRGTPAAYVEPVLFCYALINRPYILDLEPRKSVIERYLEQGFDVYLLDWGVPTHADRCLTLEDYVCRFLKEVVDFVLQARGAPRLHLIGYCIGGTLASLFSARFPEDVETLSLLAAPIDFSDQDSLLNLWTDGKYFDVDAFVAAFGNCPAWFLQSCFISLRPVQNLIEKNLALHDRLDEREFVASYFAMERWLNDNIPMAGATFREFVKKLYQGNQLVRGEFQLGERRIDLGNIRCPLLLLTAKNDHLVAPGSTEGVRPHVGSRDVKALSIDAGHVGLVVGAKAQKTLWPAATRWLADRSTAHAVPRAEQHVS
jgi:polyhydroxyalkanoate synthase